MIPINHFTNYDIENLNSQVLCMDDTSLLAALLWRWLKNQIVIVLHLQLQITTDTGDKGRLMCKKLKNRLFTWYGDSISSFEIFLQR